VLVNSIIDSTKTDKPPRFCWKAQHVSDSGIMNVDLPSGFISGPNVTLDSFRAGHLDFGPDMTETNIVIPAPDSGPLAGPGVIKLHRVPCPEPVASCSGPNDPSRCGMINAELLDARLVAIVNDPPLRARISQLMSAQPGPQCQCQPGSGPPSGAGFGFGGFGSFGGFGGEQDKSKEPARRP